MDKKISEEQKKSLIGSQACFKILNDEDLNELCTLFNEVTYKKGEVIVIEGDIVDSVFLIISGTAEVQNVYVENNVIKSDKLAELGPNQSIGLSETGLYSLTGRRTATVIAKTDMVMLRMSVTLFNGFVLSHSNVSKALHAAAEAREKKENNVQE